MSHLSLLFPGQGSQSLGMLKELSENFSEVHTIFSRASAVLNYDLWDLTQNGPVERLDQTEFTQPALLAADIAAFAHWKSTHSETPLFFAGHSLGEYAALVAAESLLFEDAIALVAKRGKYMQEAGHGAMAAIVGLDDVTVIDLCAETAGVVSPANFNSIGQIVIAGEVTAVENVIELAKKHGAKIAKKIPVSVPSHCMLMQSAAEKMAEALKSITIKKPVIPVVHNFDVKTHEDPDSIRNALIQQLIAPVHWVETIQFIRAQGVTEFFECGPGKVLMGLNKRI
ncbi:MAG: ACP S-malonyltransferase [Coxiellaceae bacterium]|nr:ACP S-malonyltransferase [Coxiellaceae bacterium]